VPTELYGGWVGGRSFNAVAQDSNHLVQPLDRVAGAAVLGDLRKLEHRLRVDDGKEAGEVRPGRLRCRKLPGRLVLRRGGRAWACLVVF
jgi:hypothetical protein